MLKPGGSIFITTLNKTLPSWLAGIIAAEYILQIVPKGTHEWNKFVSPQHVQRILDDCKQKKNNYKLLKRHLFACKIIFHFFYYR